MATKQKHRPVHVRWHDSRNLTSSWEARRRLIRRARKTPALIESVGWLIHETKHEIIIGMDYDPETDQINNASTIPKGMIKKIRDL